MSKDRKTTDTKCTVVHLPVDLIKRLDDYKEKTGGSKNSILVQLIENSLNQLE